MAASLRTAQSCGPTPPPSSRTAEWEFDSLLARWKS
jgi:hypothetical protein